MAMLSVACVLAAVCAPAHARGIQTRANQCYGDLGCFTSDNVMPLPDAPDHIRTTFRLYNRGSSNSYDLEAVGFKSHLSAWLSHFDVHKKTKIITHGFVDNGAKPWVVQMKSELLKKASTDIYLSQNEYHEERR
ncbi:hypothetical protein DPMN_134334 [Dreissena polymorpha]|uniref:Lipase domain-containing protein n=1 Tax=Dreissena polymorpha TaxID=45954 RepID=A0A9D4FYR4_DREPO|nr:hypothetical protein DPMN_134334 [Dreissena polymorpha]